MIDGKPMDPEEELRRAGEAKRFLESDFFKEACAKVESGLSMQRQRVPMRETEMHTRLILTEQLWEQLKDYLSEAAATGEFAKFELAKRERQKSIFERILQGSLRE